MLSSSAPLQSRSTITVAVGGQQEADLLDRLFEHVAALGLA